MKQNLILLLLAASLTSCGNKKKVIYVDPDDRNISRFEVWSLSKSRHYVQETENDTAITKQVLPHKFYGKLDSVQHGQVKMFLEKILGEKFDTSKKTMIHLYRKNDEKIREDAQFKKYWSYINRNSDKYQAFLIGTKFSEIEENPENNIYTDPYDQLENLFFRDSEFNLNHLLIKPDGTLYIYYGLEDILNVLDWSVD